MAPMPVFCYPKFRISWYERSQLCTDLYHHIPEKGCEIDKSANLSRLQFVKNEDLNSIIPLILWFDKCHMD